MAMSLFSLTPEEVRILVSETVTNAVKQCFLEYASKLSSQTDLISIEELVGNLKCSKPTIYNWKKKGLITDYKMENKVLYNLSEIKEAMRQKPNQFGRDREYAYKFNAFASDEQKNAMKYSTLKSRKSLGETLKIEEVQFLEDYKGKF